MSTRECNQQPSKDALVIGARTGKLGVVAGRLTADAHVLAHLVADLDGLPDQPLHRLVPLIKHPLAKETQRETTQHRVRRRLDRSQAALHLPPFFPYLETMALSRSTPRQSCVRSFEPIEYPSKISRNSLAKITLAGISHMPGDATARDSNRQSGPVDNTVHEKVDDVVHMIFILSSP